MPTQGQGSRAVMAYVQETTWGTIQGSGATWTGCRYVREGFGREINPIESQELRSDRMTAAVLRGNHRADGEIMTEIGPNSHTLLWHHLLGGSVVTAGSGPFTHTIVGSAAFPTGGLAIAKGFEDLDTPKYIPYVGCRIESVAVEFPQEGLVSAAWRFMAKNEVTPTPTKPYSSTLTYPTGDPYESNLTEAYIVAYSGAGIPGGWGSVIGIITGGRFSITNSFDGNSYVIGSNQRYSLPVGRRRIEGSLDILFLDTDYYEDFVSGAKKAVRIMFKQGALQHEFIFPNVVYAGGSPAPRVEGEQGLRFTLPFRAVRHDFGTGSIADDTDVQLVITNTESAIIRS